MRSWKDIEPSYAVTLTPAELNWVDRPTNEMGETCPWPWDPQQLKGAPLGQYHCPYCGGMVIAGVPHPDYRESDQ